MRKAADRGARRTRFTPGLVLGAIALLVALGGTAVAGEKAVRSASAEAEATKATKAAAPTVRGQRGPRGPRGFRRTSGTRGDAGRPGTAGGAGPLWICWPRRPGWTGGPCRHVQHRERRPRRGTDRHALHQRVVRRAVVGGAVPGRIGGPRRRLVVSVGHATRARERAVQRGDEHQLVGRHHGELVAFRPVLRGSAVRTVVVRGESPPVGHDRLARRGGRGGPPREERCGIGAAGGGRPRRPAPAATLCASHI